MTSRQRLLAAYRGQEVDRLPFWAKVTNPTWRSSQPDAVRRWTDLELLDYIHADAILGGPSGVRVNRPHVRVEAKTVDGRRTRVFHTPDGDLDDTWSLDPYTNSWHPTVFPIKGVEDLRRWRWLYTDPEVCPDAEQIDRARQVAEALGERGVMKATWGTSPLMDLIEHHVGPVDLHFMLHDHPEEMEELIALMHEACLAIVRTAARCCPADIIVSVENTSTTLISPRQFEAYCRLHLADYGRAIEAEGKIHELHQCGHLRDLLETIDPIPAGSIEAFTAPTLGNTRLADGRRRAPSKALVGGTNVNTWLKPVEGIREFILTELAACADHRRIVLTTAGVAPPGCPAETFRRIGEWVPTIPVRMQAA
jgi:hypothetical protein